MSEDLRDKLDISEIIDIFTSEDMENTPLESLCSFAHRMNFTSGVFRAKHSCLCNKIVYYTATFSPFDSLQGLATDRFGKLSVQ